VANSPLRWAVVLVFLLVAVLFLSNGFDGAGLASGGTGKGPGSSPSPSTTPTHTTPPATTPTIPPLAGVTVAIYNGTRTSGLAGNERQRLQADNWDVISIGDAPIPFTKTTIYYKAGAKTQALYMKAKYYTKAVVLPAVPAYAAAKISLILGTEFAATP
jgi:hypothetical protein